MRFFDKIILFKTPLDPDYVNVFDDYDTITDYIDFLKINYPNKNILIRDSNDNAVVKSAFDRNGSFSIVIPGYDSMDLHDYNYMVLYRGSDNTKPPKFAFILAVNSKNDGDDSKACELVCKLDAWSNCYEEMKTGYDVNNIVCRHMIESVKSGSDLYAIPYLTDENAIATSVKEPDEIKALLWARVTTGNEIYASHLDTHADPVATKCKGASAHKLSITTPVFYIPLFVVNPLTGKIWTNYTKAVCLDENSGNYTITMRTMIDSNGNPIGLFCSGTEILTIELTYYAPYAYSFDDTENDNKVLVEQRYFSSFNPDDINYQEVLKLSDGHNLLFTETNFLGIPTGQVPLCCATIMPNINPPYANGTYQFNIKYKYPTSLVTNEYGFYTELIGRLYYYPYNYKSVTVNSNEFPMIPSLDRERASYKLDSVNSVKPLIRFFYTHKDGTTKDYYDMINSDGNGQLVTTVDSLEYYMRNNGSKLVVSAINDALSFALKLSAPTTISENEITMQNIKNRAQYERTGSAVNFGSGIANTAASIIDIEKQMDTYNRNSSNALDNMYRQDYVLVKEYMPIKNMDYYLLMRKLHDYGLNINMRLSVRENTHTVFDFVKTSNCVMPMIGNIEDRREIENAYDRGINRWHLSWYGNVIKLRNFDKNIPNLDTVQYDYYNE